MTFASVLVLNGPNLNLLGTREPTIYGSETLADVAERCRQAGERLGLAIDFRQSNAEHQLIDWLHDARERVHGIVINPAAYTHTSVALADALKAIDKPVIEVHISNVHKREAFRHHSYVSPIAEAIIVGCGTQGYVLALERMAELLKANEQRKREAGQ
ncbi:type II 3-dehydroquinate dehydratase [Trinickia diaoshuihuensis]|jgi:3-dehydroquinate dehydratase-2|uniref:type II 3-dehydroquinate dehydratase n=1 Tax=Trinickia diaoshuihuensis TaxID=2292265 RepID=UPI000E2551AC|nr:type II 3-dehydroquinate dehydratase [Trinickia diaoshuihuensis]